MLILINKLKGYGPSNPKKIKSRQEVLDNAEKLYNIRNGIINAFESKIFFRHSDVNNITKDFSGQTDIDKQSESVEFVAQPKKR